MTGHESPLIHPTAIISHEAKLAPTVRVGPYCIIEGPVELGENCILGPYVHMLGHTTVGQGNTFHTGCVIGDIPQHLGYANEPTKTIIGEGNVFREQVTIHRGMPATGATIIGNGNFLMANAHIAHDCRVGNKCIMANGAVLGGHVQVQDNVFISAGSAMHQFCRVGRLAMIGGLSAASQDVPPFWIIQHINVAVGVNVVGMKRAGMSSDEIMAVRRAFKTIARSGKTVSISMAEVEVRDGNSPAVREILEFIRASKRGITPGVRRQKGTTTED